MKTTRIKICQKTLTRTGLLLFNANDVIKSILQAKVSKFIWQRDRYVVVQSSGSEI